MSQIIKVKDLKKKFEDKEIIKGISFDIQEQEYVAIMGPSGAGKTTTLNLISGLEKPTSGSVIIDGVDMASLKEPKLTKFRAKNIGYIFQDYKLVDYLSIKENITLNLKINHEKFDEKKYDKIIKTLGIDKYKKNSISKLSGGQKQRVAIARGLIGDNKIIFGDEPTGALDVFTRDEILDELIKNAKQYKKTLVVVTHDPYVASKAQRIIFIKDGKVESINKPMNETAISKKLMELEKHA